jgi:glycosyltransferase involved in cell wall biosynthesis
VIYPGSLDFTYQRILEIITTLDELRALEFLIIGRVVSQNIKEQIQKLSLQLKRINITYFEDLPYETIQEKIAESRVGIIPLLPLEKYKKNIPTKMFEYIMHSIPQVDSDLPPISHYLKQTQSGFCIGETDYVQNFANKIVKILDDYHEYSHLASLDKQLLRDNWNWKIQEEKLTKIIDQLL